MKKSLIFIVFCIGLGLFALGASASSPPVVMIGNAAGYPGDEIEIPIYVDARDIVTIAAEININNNVLLYDSAISNAPVIFMVDKSNIDKGWLDMIWIDTYEQNRSFEGENIFAKLIFQIKSSAAEGVYPLSINNDSFIVGSMVENELNHIQDAVCKDGYITVLGEQYQSALIAVNLLFEDDKLAEGVTGDDIETTQNLILALDENHAKKGELLDLLEKAQQQLDDDIFEEIRYGYVLDGEDITVSDAIAILRHIVGLQMLSQESQIRAKVTPGDGAISVQDAIVILRYIVGLTHKLPIEEINCVITEPYRPSGNDSGLTDTSYTYSTGGASCSYGHNVQYRFDFSDGNYSNWSSSVSNSKTWNSAGNYNVRAQARCSTETSMSSSWSQSKTVTISTKDVNSNEYIYMGPSETSTIGGGIGLVLDQPNSVGGVSWSVKFKNISSKTIKYITFSVVPYNAVGDIVECSIKNSSISTGRITGPIEAGVTTGWYTSDNAWYNHNIRDMKLFGDVEIIFMDDTSVTLDAEDIDYSFGNSTLAM